MKRLPQGDELYKRAQKLGVSIQELGHADGTYSEPELQRRVIEAERAKRESRLRIIALFSAVVGALGALAAWIAVLSYSK